MTEAELVKAILEVSPARKLRAETSDAFGNSDARLAVLARRLTKSGPTPSVLWNVRPWNEFNVIHAVYTEKLCSLQEIGLDVVVLFYDMTLSKRLRVPAHELDSVNAAVENCIRRMRLAGLRDSKTEYIRESDLWDGISFRDFAETVTSIAHSAGEVSTDSRGGSPSDTMDQLSELYYERVLDPAIVVLGESDVREVWGLVRSEMVLAQLIPRYELPILLYLPSIAGVDGLPLRTSDSKNSLSIFDDDAALVRKLSLAPESFLASLYELLIVPWSARSGGTHSARSYAELAEDYPDEDSLRTALTKLAAKYFSRVRDTR